MYGLASRDSLSKRQSRWTRDANEIVAEKPAQTSLTKEDSALIPREKSTIISMMAETHTDSASSLSSNRNSLLRKNEPTIKPFNNHLMDIIPEDDTGGLQTMQRLYEELHLKLVRVEQECETLRKLVNDKAELSSRILKLEQASNIDSISDLSQRVGKLEQNPLYSKLEQNPLYSKLEQNSKVELGSLYSKLEQNSHLEPGSLYSKLVQNFAPKCEFVPFAIKEEYAGRDNISRLNNGELTMTVEIPGSYSEELILYPFGTETDLPKFAELVVNMIFQDSNFIEGTVYGILKRNEDGIYTLHPDDFYSEGNIISVDSCTLPLTIKCNTTLIAE